MGRTTDQTNQGAQDVTIKFTQELTLLEKFTMEIDNFEMVQLVTLQACGDTDQQTKGFVMLMCQIKGERTIAETRERRPNGVGMMKPTCLMTLQVGTRLGTCIQIAHIKLYDSILMRVRRRTT